MADAFPVPEDRSYRRRLIESRFADGRWIPEEIQAPMRERLRMMRESRGLSRTSLNRDVTPGVSSGTAVTLELHDISTMTLAQMRVLANHYEMDFREFVVAVVAGADEITPHLGGDTVRMNRLLRRLDPRDVTLIHAIIDTFIDVREGQEAVA